MVLLTASAGIHLAPGSTSQRVMWLSLLGTSVIVASANALNMWWESDVDARMSRTKGRPLPTGRISPHGALGFGVFLGLVGLPLLFAVNVVTGILGGVALLTYVLLYTPMKKRSSWALWVGAIPGAMPPLLGWTTSTGELDPGGLSLFAIMFFWQIPHFAAIALFRKDEYRRAGLSVLPVEKGDETTWRTMVSYAAFTALASLLPASLHIVRGIYVPVAATLGLFFVVTAMRGFRNQSDPAARRVFGASMLYLTALFVALVALH